VSPARHRLDEFALIRKLWAPLARGFPDAYGLADDVAYVALEGGGVRAGEELVLKCDALVEGVHFLPDDPAELVAQKLLRVNLSDLAAKGARPIVYLLTLMLPASLDDAWLERFAAGLAADQNEFGILLAGGDTVATPGPLALSLAVVGAIPAGRRLLRAAAKAGDAVFVSGTIGDAALGLMARSGTLAGVTAEEGRFLSERYRLPRPRLSLGQRLRGLVHATMDISDGLIGDLEHIAEASGVAATIEVGSVPLSPAARAALTRDARLIESVLAGGDDYELLFTAPPRHHDALLALGRELGVPVTRVGTIASGSGVRALDPEGREIKLARTGYRHF